ncbi:MULTISPECIES: thioesterase II family protein [Streptomyces]|uniref:Thioesterase n=1 Tax=Streptomyces tsukubensis (strain DSM 42081 / NBRC 108919 / NRRL 18488 / 9993) TaxID=1114943 RepID=I2MTK4_STRT9|nr:MULTISPECIES: thioesterase domain-containing protein [Streptomyces]AZK92677.1 thioesterase [Streptomyces tsukubensis]EIF88101.1 thioesterase [Streptomyces tsukubensis NRRL18488]MYS68233.1 thioesterase [Streptomyces sp. SID5473]QKM71153.1 thioesterase [Streptomyces tsukubensis NRRL18488]TAI40660.1 thioesterase [Streptomyces tsukubensis]
MTHGGIGPHTREDFRTPYLAVRPEAVPDAPLRLFCLHHAGGGASIFRDWQRALGPSVAVLPVQLPGRERRVREPRFTDMATLVGELNVQLDPYLRVPYALYGHSMGALVAWQLSAVRAAAGRRLPEALLAGACNPPDVPPVSAATRDMSQQRLVRWLLDAGGISEELLRYPDWVDAAVSVLRDDLDLCNSHRPPDADGPGRLPFPIHVFAGASDSLVGAGTMTGWARHSSVPGERHTVPGGHLFLRDSPDHLFGLLRPVLAGLAPGLAD